MRRIRVEFYYGAFEIFNPRRSIPHSGKPLTTTPMATMTGSMSAPSSMRRSEDRRAHSAQCFWWSWTRCNPHFEHASNIAVSSVFGRNLALRSLMMNNEWKLKHHDNEYRLILIRLGLN
jgi:hypothetical protein